MKSIAIVLGILILAIISCEDGDMVEHSFVSAKLNEKNWDGAPEIRIHDTNDTLILLGVGNEQVLVFKFKFDGEGAYDLLGNQASYYTTVGGDAITSLYTLDLSSSSQIVITEYNSEQNSIKGNFEISLLKKWSNPENNINMLGFTEGQFKGIISK